MPPANDDFANAQVLAPPSGTFSGDTTGCTTELPDDINLGVWFSFTPTTTGWYSFSLDYGTIQHAIMAVFEGSSLATLTIVDTFGEMCPSDAGGANVWRNVLLTSGTTYHLQLIHTSSAHEGTYTLAWQAYVTPTAGPAYDNIADALMLTSDGSPHTITVTTVASTMETNEYGQGSAEPGIWLKIDASGGVTPFTVNLDFSATGFNPFVDLWGTATGFVASLPDWRLLSSEPGGNSWPGDGTSHPAAATVTIDPADSANGIFYLFVSDWDSTDSPCFVSPAQGSVDITYTIDGAVATPATGVARDHPVKMVYVTGHYDVAGIDGSGTRTWSDYSATLPDPVGEGNWSGYEYRYLFKIGDRFYLPFAAGSLYVTTPDVYVYSWALGEVDWTFEWSTSYAGTGGLVPIGTSDWDHNTWDAATDGTSIFVVFTTSITVSVDCGGGVHHDGTITFANVYTGTTVGTYTSLGNILGTTFRNGTGSGIKLALCASANDVGNAYMVASEAGIDVCTGEVTTEDTWVCGWGPTATLSPTALGDKQHLFMLSARYVDASLSGEFPAAFINDFTIVNDGDDVQVICRLPELIGGPSAGFNQHTISVYKPLDSWSTMEQGETNSSTGPGWDYWYEDSVLTFETDDAFTKVVTPLWTETGGRQQRAIVANFADFDDIIGLDADGVTLHHLHDSTNLDSTKLVDDGGVEASIDETGPGGYYIPGIYYDSVKNEYWAIYQNLSDLRSSVATPACGVLEWKGVPFTAGGTGVLSVGQGPFESDTFYAIANTSGDITAASVVIAIPICRGCKECA